MNIIICSTRLYYSYYFSKWEKDADLTTSLSGALDCDWQKFFSDERNCGTKNDVTLYWKDYTYKDLKILKREIDTYNILYAVPCIPKDQIEDGLELDLEERQNYIGKIAEVVLQNYLDIPCEIFIIAHDLDIFEEEAEQLLKKEDIIDDTLLAKVVEEYSIGENHIYGFQHTDGITNYNIMFTLLQELIDVNINSDIATRIIDIFKMNEEE